MTKQNFKELEDEDIILIKAIIYLCGNSKLYPICVYDAMEIQGYLNKKGYFSKYKFYYDKQFEVLNKLINKNIIEADQIVSNNPNLITPDDIPTLHWKNDKDWAHKIIQFNDYIGIEEAYKKYGSNILIKMTTDDAQKIHNTYLSDRLVELMFDTFMDSLKIRVDKKEWTRLPAFDTDKNPFKVIKYAWEHKNEFVTRDDMIKYGIIDKKYENKYLKSQILEGNATVQALSPLLIDFNVKKIA